MKKLLVLTLLLLSGIAAAETRYNFSYTGLYNVLDFPYDTFVPGAKYLGSFTVEDSNGDGTYQRDEVLEFSIGFGSDPYLFDVLRASEIGYWAYFGEFNYTPGGELTFTVGHQAIMLDSVWYTDHSYRHSFGPRFYETGPRTIIKVVQVVPEPSTSMMFIGGIAGVLLAARRRQSTTGARLRGIAACSLHD
jgi:hypothetical protein